LWLVLEMPAAGCRGIQKRNEHMQIVIIGGTGLTGSKAAA
jgi:hypothetical protein